MTTEEKLDEAWEATDFSIASLQGYTDQEGNFWPSKEEYEKTKKYNNLTDKTTSCTI